MYCIYISNLIFLAIKRILDNDKINAGGLLKIFPLGFLFLIVHRFMKIENGFLLHIVHRFMKMIIFVKSLFVRYFEITYHVVGHTKVNL